MKVDITVVLFPDTSLSTVVAPKGRLNTRERISIGMWSLLGLSYVQCLSVSVVAVSVSGCGTVDTLLWSGSLPIFVCLVLAACPHPSLCLSVYFCVCPLSCFFFFVLLPVHVIDKLYLCEWLLMDSFVLLELQARDFRGGQLEVRVIHLWFDLLTVILVYTIHNMPYPWKLVVCLSS